MRFDKTIVMKFDKAIVIKIDTLVDSINNY